MTKYTCEACGSYSTEGPMCIPHTLDCPYMQPAVVPAEDMDLDGVKFKVTVRVPGTATMSGGPEALANVRCPHCRMIDGSHAKWCIAAPENNLTRVPAPAEPESPPAAPSGAKLEGEHYYRVRIAAPMSPEIDPYIVECGDIIEALNMTFNEGELFKAIWRLAKSRQGRGKPGNSVIYDAEKVGHYGARVLAHTKLTYELAKYSKPSAR